EPQTPRADLELDRGIGHAMCLNLVNKLKAVLDRAQKDVRMRQLVPHRLADQAGPRERVERDQRAGLPKRRVAAAVRQLKQLREELDFPEDRKSTRLNSSHLGISYAVFCLKKKKQRES